MVKLKPCPFCGNEAYIEKFGGGCVYIACRRCGCRTGTHYAETHDKAIVTAVSAWNDQPMQARLEAAEEVCRVAEHYHWDNINLKKCPYLECAICDALANWRKVKEG